MAEKKPYEPSFQQEIGAGIWKRLHGEEYDPRVRFSKEQYEKMCRDLADGGWKWYPKLGIWQKQRSLFDEQPEVME